MTRENRGGLPPRPGSNDRSLARIVLVVIAVLMAALVMISGPGLGGGISSAQQTESPTPTESPTESPTEPPPPTGPTVEIINPSGHSQILSDQQDSDTTYHLNAWVADPPDESLVEFEIQRGTQRPVTIGTASRVGSDTFEYFWDIPPGFADGQYTLRAFLFADSGTGFEEIDRDEELVDIMGEALTVELAYPSNGGALGLFTTSDGESNAVFDVVFSAGTEFIDVYYTISLPGEEPQWTNCGNERQGAAANGVRCTLGAGDSPFSVTAVAATAGETPGPIGGDVVDSGDAHRIFPYAQRPANVALTPASQRVDPQPSGSFACSPPIVATATDQLGRAIAALNLDVHATGPTDQLSFDTGPSSSRNQPPDMNHTGTEVAFDCQENTQGGLQADHQIPAGADRKHVESVAGTNDVGQFAFRLKTDGPGATQITAWGEFDDDDLLCSEEASGDASIGWGQDPPAPTGQSAETSNCPPPPPPPQCADGADNDGDGLTDSQDPGCTSPSDTSETGTIACDDGTDNDGDGLTDSQDPGCTSPSDTSETGTIACDDGADNDGDGVTDSDDPGCTSPTDTSETGTTACDDGTDNDGDGDVDYPEDDGCRSPGDEDEADEKQKFESVVTIRGSFKGDVTSDKAKCVKGRKVVVFKKREGDDKKVGKDKTNKNGRWNVPKDDPEGRFYAKAKKKKYTTSRGTTVVCKAAKSETIEK